MRRLLNSSGTRVALGFVLSALVLAALGWIVTGPTRQYPGAFDSYIRFTMRQLQSPMWTSLFLAVTKLGSTLYLWIIGIVVGIAFVLLRWFRPLALLILVMAGQSVLHYGFKWLIARPRPAALIGYREIESSSFPSGHAVAGLCLYGMIAWLFASRLENTAAKVSIAISASVLVFLIGMSRVYIGVHYPSDVIAGFIGAAIWLGAVVSVDRKEL